jgi:hypothetical protein
VGRLTVSEGGTWSDLEGVVQVDAARDMRRSYVRVFESNDGAAVLEELRRLFLEREALPTQSDAELRHLEGQRSLVRHILRQIEAGKR